MATENHELIVVGAGPAGTMAAYHAARQGVRVTILDRAPGSRPKPCAGGLSTKALAQLPFSVAHIVQKSTQSISLGLGAAPGQPISAQGLLCGFVVRHEFDGLLLDRARQAGADYQLVDRITDLSVAPDHVRLDLGDGRSLNTGYLIAADGANSQIRRLADPQGAFSRGFALEGIVPRASLSGAPGMELNFGCLPFGYGWVFPKGDHVNVGIYTSRDRVPLGKDILRNYARAKLGTQDVQDIMGFPLGFGGKTYRPTQERLLFAGDAAGMVEPLLGEGIFNALRSGEMAGRAVAGAVAQGTSARGAYDVGLRSIRRDLRRGELICNLFYEHLDGFGFRALQNPMIRAILIKGYAAGKTFHQITDGFALMPWQKPLRSDRIDELQG
ncbi:geranylgeranyl reductase family protein [Thalassovita sp.]|uniref:geranylgeranyl reductase family protein n=1 Tax=Thalassovita sp. TaxID=1979401 RepID=UPI003B5B6CFC